MFRSAMSLVVGLVASLSLLVGTASATLVEITDTFDSDPGWIGVGNRDNGQNFGFSNSSNAGGAAGEIGGLLNRDTWASSAYYAKDLGTFTLDDEFLFQNYRYGYNDAGDGDEGQGILVGLFNRNGAIGSWPVSPMLGIETAEGSAYAYANFGAGVANETYIKDFVANGTISVHYNPSAGSYGAFSVTLDGTTSTYSLTEAQRISDATFDSFGLMTLPNNSPNVEATTNFYLDAVPEPSAIIILASGILGLLAYAWRQRKCVPS